MEAGKMDERYHFYSSSRNFYYNDQPGRAMMGFGTAVLGSQGRQVASMKLILRKRGCRHLALHGD